MNDREFLLTFNDGPSLDQGANTKKIINQLKQSNLNAIFFVLGERLATLSTKEIKSIYKNQCVGSHGYTHESHPKYDQWKESIDRTLDLITSKLGVAQNTVWFRPPYAQRSTEMLNHLQKRDALKVMLWNIDSQDWIKERTPKEINDRIVTIMLLWRKGIIMFHDLYGRNAQTLKNLNTLANNASLTYVNCNTMVDSIK